MRSTGAICFLLIVIAICLTQLADAHSSHAEYDHYARRYYSNPRHCARCLPGWGLVKLCNHTHPTVCTPCTDDTWSPHRPHLSRCQPCSKCGDRLYEEHKCRPDRDTRCDSCDSKKGIFTEDFIRKCAPVDDKKPDNSFQQAVPLIKLEEEEKRNEQNVGVPDDGEREHEFWDFKKSRGPLDVTDEQRIVIKPSYHEYDYDLSARMRMAAYRQKFYVLLGCGGVLVLIAVVFLIWLVRECRRPMHRVITGRQKLYVHLTDQDNEIIRQCAYDLQRKGKLRSFSDMENDDEYWEEPVHITENPLEHYMAFGSTERLVPKAKC